MRPLSARISMSDRSLACEQGTNLWNTSRLQIIPRASSFFLFSSSLISKLSFVLVEKASYLGQLLVVTRLKLEAR